MFSAAFALPDIISFGSDTLTELDRPEHEPTQLGPFESGHIKKEPIRVGGFGPAREATLNYMVNRAHRL